MTTPDDPMTPAAPHVPEPTQASASTTLLAAGQIRRLAWLHFANDLSLDFITPLLTAGVAVAWIGVMEGLADSIGQVLKLATGRASDRSGVRAPWVRSGYLINAVARPLIGVGLLLTMPAWMVGCRIMDRIGKGIRGSATDALVADWSDGQARALAFARMRTMDHLGATIGGLGAALAAYLISPHHLWIAMCALVVVTLWVALLARGLRDQPPQVRVGAIPSGWWPRSAALRTPLGAIAIGAIATKLSPLIMLVQVAGIPGHTQSPRWPLYLVCLGWAALGLVQAGAAAVAGVITARVGPATMVRLGWFAGALVFIGLALAHGPWLMAVGVAFGVLVGLTEGAEKTWIANCAPASERSLSFGALALVIAISGLVGNIGCAALLAWWGPQVFLVLAALALGGILISTLGAGTRHGVVA